MLRSARILAILLLVSMPATAFAELYKYRTADGDIIITTEKRSDLELVEIVSEDGKAKSKRKKSASKTSKSTSTRRAATTSTPRPAFPRAESAREGVPKENQFDDIIREACAAYDVPFGFVKAVIRVESNFNPSAVSHAGAMGLMQLMPRTAASLNVTDPFDPRQNIFGGTKFLRILIDRYDGDINLILAAYNAGDAAVARYDGIPYAKTRGYVASVYKYYQQYSAAEGAQ